MFVAVYQAGHAQRDEGDAEQLALVQSYEFLHLELPRFLHLLEYFHEEAERENAGQAPAEVEARAHFLRPLAVEPEARCENQQVGHGLVELSGVARKHVAVGGKHKAPIRTRVFTHDFRVHEVAQPYAARRYRCGYGYVVQHGAQRELGLAAVEPEGCHQAQRAAVRGQPRVARKVPCARSVLPDGQQHFYGVCEEVARGVEQAVPQTCANQDADEAVEEERVELLVGDALSAVEPLHNEVGGAQAQHPEQRVVAQGHGSYLQRLRGLPLDN